MQIWHFGPSEDPEHSNSQKLHLLKKKKYTGEFVSGVLCSARTVFNPPLMANVGLPDKIQNTYLDFNSLQTMMLLAIFGTYSYKNVLLN